MEVKDVLHFYLGRSCFTQNGEVEKLFSINDSAAYLSDSQVSHGLNTVKPILRKIADMGAEDAAYFAWLCMNSEHHLDDESRIPMDDIDIELVPNDGGNMLDGNVLLYIGVSVRCFEGAIIFQDDGSIYVVDEDGKRQEPIDDIAVKIAWLISKGYDVFRLIDSEQAVDEATIN
jgi:hypothetical protein